MSCLPLPASRSKVAEVDGEEENTDLELACQKLFALFAVPKLGEAEDGVLVLLMIELRHLILGRAYRLPLWFVKEYPSREWLHLMENRGPKSTLYGPKIQLRVR